MRLQGKFAGWTVRIEDRAGRRLNEYRPTAVAPLGTTSETPGMECFVECEGDQEFAVMIERPSRPSGSAAHPVDSRGPDTALHLFADGRCLRRNVVQVHDPDAIAFKHVHESRDGAWYKTRLRFASLSTTESPSGETRGLAELDSLGTVEIVFRQGRCNGEMSGPPGSAEGKLDFGPVDELSKKMIGHTVCAGESSLVEAPTTSFGFTKRNPFKPDYRVVFHYRTRSLLMAEGIVERPAQSPPTNEYDVLFRKRKRGVRFDTPRRGGEAGPGPGVALKTKSLGAYRPRPRGKVQFKIKPRIEGTVQGSEEFPIDLTDD